MKILNEGSNDFCLLLFWNHWYVKLTEKVNEPIIKIAKVNSFSFKKPKLSKKEFEEIKKEIEELKEKRKSRVNVFYDVETIYSGAA